MSRQECDLVGIGKRSQRAKANWRWRLLTGGIWATAMCRAHGNVWAGHRHYRRAAAGEAEAIGALVHQTVSFESRHNQQGSWA